jgi:hypothetical protein
VLRPTPNSRPLKQDRADITDVDAQLHKQAPSTNN